MSSLPTLWDPTEGNPNTDSDTNSPASGAAAHPGDNRDSRIVAHVRPGCQDACQCNAFVSKGLALGLSLALAAVTAACGGRSAVPRPFPTPGGTARTGVAAPASPFVEALLRTATDLLGTPYRNGGSTLDGFDCSGFVQYVFAQQGIRVPRTVVRQVEVGSKVREPQAGDLVFFATEGDRATHVGIALGPDRFIHAPSSRGVVRVEPFASAYWSERFLEARRVGLD
jgi:cell wall-associated NlpC family hydrolase